MKKSRICSQGHHYYKSSDCPVCPVCEQARVPESRFLERLSAPARRALEHAGIATIQQLSAFSEKEILGLHGMGPASLPQLRAALAEENLSFLKGKPQ